MHEPPHDPPTEDVLDEPLVAVKINQTWMSHVMGLFSVAADQDYWKSDQVRGEQSAIEILDLMAKGNAPVFDLLSVRVRGTINQSVAHATTVLVTYDTVDWDVGGLWNPGVPQNIALPELGLWAIGATVAWQQNVAGSRRLRLKTGSGHSFGWNSELPVADRHFQPVFQFWRVTAPDIVFVYARQTSGVTLNLEPQADSSIVFWANYLGPL